MTTAEPIIPARALGVIKAYAAWYGYPLDVFLGRRPGAETMALKHTRWRCWAALLAMPWGAGGRISKLQVARWFSVHHTTVMAGVDARLRLRKAARRRWIMPERRAA